jgi:hypothetical protein
MAKTSPAGARSNGVESLRRLASIIPFRYLKSSELRDLSDGSRLREYGAGEILIVQGDRTDDDVFVLLTGSVESIDATRKPPFRMNVVEAGSYFGERSCLLGEARRFEVRALEPSACLVITGERFLRLLADSRPFAQAFGNKLREGLGLFDAFDRFIQAIVHGVDTGHIEVRKLLEFYKTLGPALHPLAQDESAIDWEALSYAVRRLPENVCRTFIFLLTDNLPTVYASPELLFPAVPAEARHRFIYEMMPGKDMVLVRNGLSDLVDFLTCLCLFSVEARKIRYRLNHPSLIRALSRFEEEAEWVEPLEPETAEEADARSAQAGYDADIAAGDEAGTGEAERGGPGPVRDFRRSTALLERLPFSREECEKLERIWPGQAAERVREIVFHRQAYSVDIRKQVNNYNSRLSELWASEVGAAAGALFGVRPSDFPDDYEVHIVSSNTHSVSNCLNPYFVSHAGEILDWAGAEGLRTEGWSEPMDEVYHLSRSWFAAFPERRPEIAAAERSAGILRLPETVTTGIQVQLVDAEAACREVGDPGVRHTRCVGRSFIVNIDYAFGEQAEEITRNLILLFGRNVRSINVLGKAGALVGGRGDVICPSAFVEQSGDTFMPVPPLEPACAERLARALPGRGIHNGPLLTVRGTLLQNRAMLQFYRRIWGCVGLEMEGAWYLRAVHEAEELGVLPPSAALRFLYYVSDLPLESGQRLSERLSPLEGVPPLYAVTREVLSYILS